jgi:hypothetical protein
MPVMPPLFSRFSGTGCMATSRILETVNPTIHFIAVIAILFKCMYEVALKGYKRSKSGFVISICSLASRVLY